MTDLLTAARMRAIETAAIESRRVTGLELMERAGAGVVAAVFEEWPELAQGTHRAVVLCGPGNNGGDGFVVARLLHQAGWSVEVYFHGDVAGLPPDARVNCERWGALRAILPFGLFGPDRGAADVLFDAIFGTGLSRPPVGAVSDVMSAARDARGRSLAKRLVAVDVPSGLCADSGKRLGHRPGLGGAVDLTVTFHAEKPGHRLAQGPESCGKTVVVDIGLDPFISLNKLPPEAPVRAVDGVAGAVAKQTGHKFDHGHALILTGGPGRTGAARLAARGALRIGAGLVSLGVPPSAQMEVASHITALMLMRVADGDGLAAVLEDGRINALCVGPGLGLDDHAASLVDAVLGAGHLRLTRHVVFDADALTLIAQDGARMEALSENAVLTPHGGEFARLFPDIAEKLAAVPDRGPAYSKVDATRDAARRSGAVVLFKGPDTVIAHPDGRCSIHAAGGERAAPWLATAGAGDVLAGFITGLLARGFDPMAACETAAWLHVECARAFGPGLIAEDLPEVLPQVLRALEG